jgi:hypothetical protein
MIIPSKHNGYTRDGVRRVYIDSGNDAPPQPTTTVVEEGPTVQNSTVTNKRPDYINANTKSIVKRATDYSNKPYEAYTGERVAEFTPDMLTAMERMRNQGVAGEIDEASGLAGLAGRRASDYGMFQEGVQQYMNPYMQNVVDIERRKAQEEADRKSATLSGQAAKQGAFGGSGAALQQRALTRDTAQQLADIQALGLDRAYKSATDQYNTGITNMLSSAGQLGTLGTTRFGQETDLIKNLGTSGDIQRQRIKDLNDVAYNNWLEEQGYEGKKLAELKTLTSDLEYDTSTNTNSVTTPGKRVEQRITDNPAADVEPRGGNYASGGITSLLSDQQIDQRQQMPNISDLARLSLQAKEMEYARMRADQQNMDAQQATMAQRPTVADEEMARIAALEDGIGRLEVRPDLVGSDSMAGGGIVAFSNLGEVPAADDEVVRRAKIKQRQGMMLTPDETIALKGGATRLNTGSGERTGGGMGILDSMYGPQEEYIRAAGEKEIAAQKAYMEDIGKEKGEAKEFASKAREKIEGRMAGLSGEDRSALESSVLDFGLRLLSAKGEKNMAKALAGAGLNTLAGHKQALKDIAAKRDRYEDALMKVDEFEYGENKGTRKEERAALLNLGKAEAGLQKELGGLLGERAKDVFQLFRDRESRAHAAKTAGINNQSVDRQTFDALVRESGGDVVAARKKYNELTGAKTDTNNILLKGLQEELVKAISGPMADGKVGQAQIARIRSEIANLSGDGGSGGQSGGKMVTMADIRATAAKQGMTEKQVMDAAKAKGYTIQ